MSSFAVTPGFAVRRPARRAAQLLAPAPLRLTRRGRLVLTVLFLGVLLVALTVFGAHSAATGQAGAPVQTRTVEVGQGDTLWGIASKVSEPGQVRQMVLKIEQLNALNGPALVEGQEIAVPVG
jgi:LysM repeat protein